MSDRIIVLQRVIQHRSERPSGLRIWSDGLVERSSSENVPPGPDDRLDRDRELSWTDVQHLTDEQVAALKEVIRRANFFDLPPVLLINYCTEDPGTAIWTVTLDDSTWRVVVFDPRPRRSPALDILNNFLKELLETSAV